MDATRRLFLVALGLLFRGAGRLYIGVAPSKPCRVPTMAEWKAMEARLPEIARSVDLLTLTQ